MRFEIEGGQLAVAASIAHPENQHPRYRNGPEYPISNETYSSMTVNKLCALRGIDRYIGICGGGNQNLFLCNMLQNSNDIHTATLVDVSPNQLSNFFRISDMYCKSNTSDEFVQKLEYWLGQNDQKPHIDRPDLAPFCYKPTMTHGTTFDLVENSIGAYLEGFAVPGKHFVYLSNALLYGSLNNPREVLSSIQKNKSFEEGTTLMAVDNNLTSTYFLTKDNGGFSVSTEYGKESVRMDAEEFSPYGYIESSIWERFAVDPLVDKFVGSFIRT